MIIGLIFFASCNETFSCFHFHDLLIVSCAFFISMIRPWNPQKSKVWLKKKTCELHVFNTFFKRLIFFFVRLIFFTIIKKSQCYFPATKTTIIFLARQRDKLLARTPHLTSSKHYFFLQHFTIGKRLISDIRNVANFSSTIVHFH